MKPLCDYQKVKLTYQAKSVSYITGHAVVKINNKSQTITLTWASTIEYTSACMSHQCRLYLPVMLFLQDMQEAQADMSSVFSL